MLDVVVVVPKRNQSEKSEIGPGLVPRKRGPVRRTPARRRHREPDEL